MVFSAAYAGRSLARVSLARVTLLFGALLLGVTAVGAADATAHEMSGGYSAPRNYASPPPPFYVTPYGPAYGTPYYGMPYYENPPAPYRSFSDPRFNPDRDGGGSGDRGGYDRGRSDGDRGGLSRD
jgi:hypothetical protein